jgi:hypothetical protein
MKYNDWVPIEQIDQIMDNAEKYKWEASHILDALEYIVFNGEITYEDIEAINEEVAMEQISD